MQRHASVGCWSIINFQKVFCNLYYRVPVKVLQTICHAVTDYL